MLQVRHTVDYIPKYGYVEGEPKTKAGRRKIILPSFMVEMLQEHRVMQEQERKEMGDAWENKYLVFPDLKGGYFNPSYLLRAFGKILRGLGLPHMVSTT